MSSLALLMAEQRRRMILDVLQSTDSRAANDRVLRLAIENGLAVTTLDLIRADLNFLANHLLVLIEKIDESDVWLVKLTDQGSAVARGLAHQGIADRGLS